MQRNVDRPPQTPDVPVDQREAEDDDDDDDALQASVSQC